MLGRAALSGVRHAVRMPIWCCSG